MLLQKYGVSYLFLIIDDNANSFIGFFHLDMWFSYWLSSIHEVLEPIIQWVYILIAFLFV